MADIFARHKQLSEKYKLPSFEELDKEFEISTIDTEPFLLRAIMQRMADKIEFFSMLIESVLSPDTIHLSSMHECRFFDDAEKNALFLLYNKLMDSNREFVEVSLLREEKEEAAFVSEFFTKWKELKKELFPMVRKMKESWAVKTTIKDELEYLG